MCQAGELVFLLTGKTRLRFEHIETFGSGIKKIYTLCDATGVDINYINADTDFKIEFSRIDRNKAPLSGQMNGRINDYKETLCEEARSLIENNKKNSG